MLRMRLGATMVALAVLSLGLTTSSEARPPQAARSCSSHKISCDSGCARSKTPNHWSCVGKNSCESRFKKCLRTRTWTTLMNNPGPRAAEPW